MLFRASRANPVSRSFLALALGVADGALAGASDDSGDQSEQDDEHAFLFRCREEDQSNAGVERDGENGAHA